MDGASPLRCAMPSPASPTPLVTLQSDVVLPPEVTEDALASLAGHILFRENMIGEWELVVHVVDDETMQSAHDEFMGIDAPTDIMTFPYAEEGDDFGPDASGEWHGDVAGGDLMISIDTAAENAAAAGWSTAEELFFLVAHGVLHLVGWDDQSADDRRVMLERQAELISEWQQRP